MSQKDLIPIKTTARAKELGRKGGLVRSLSKQLSKRVYCNNKCPLYSKCRYITMSQDECDGKCALKFLSIEKKNAYKNLICKGEDGLIAYATNALSQIDDDYKQITGAKIIHSMTYGDKVKNEITTKGSFFDAYTKKLDEIKSKEDENK